MTTYIPESPCIHGHLLRYSKSGACVECVQRRNDKWRKAHRDKHNLAQRVRRARNPQKNRDESRAWRKANPDKVKLQKQRHSKTDSSRARQAAAYQKNKSTRQLQNKLWRSSNRELFRTYQRKYKIKLRSSLPPWLTSDDWWLIDEVYDLARLRTQLTGVPHHVDHEIPLQGKTVSGLHVPLNLRVITQEENQRKNNRYVT